MRPDCSSFCAELHPGRGMGLVNFRIGGAGTHSYPRDVHNLAAHLSIMNKTSLKSAFKNKRGFTLVEIICVVVLLGLFGSIGVALMRDTASTGRTNVLQKNADELNNATNNLRAAGAIFATGTTAVTSGSTTTSASITLPTPATAASISAFIGALEGTTGIPSASQPISAMASPTPPTPTLLMRTASRYGPSPLARTWSRKFTSMYGRPHGRPYIEIHFPQLLEYSPPHLYHEKDIIAPLQAA